MSDLDGTYLGRILDAKREELQTQRQAYDLRRLGAAMRTLPPPRDFIGALTGLAGPSLPPRAIAEFKRASPSQGAIREGADPAAIAQSYVASGAACMSVLVDPHFQGSFEDLIRVRQAVSIPLLAKDFVLDRSQIARARVAGADAVLLIVAALEPPRLRDLLRYARSLGMQALVESHDARELERALAAGAKLVGVNARDLKTFEVDLQRCVELRKYVPREGFCYVAESGIGSRADVAALRAAKVDAILVGTRLMRDEDPGAGLAELLGGVAKPGSA